MSFMEMFQQTRVKRNTDMLVKLRKYQKKVWEDFKASGLNLAYSASRRYGKDLGILRNVDEECIATPKLNILYLFLTQEQAIGMVTSYLADETKTPYLGGVIDTSQLVMTRSGDWLHNGNTLLYKNGSKIIFSGIGNYNSKVGDNKDMLILSEGALYGAKFEEIINILGPNMALTGGKIIAVSTPRLGSEFNNIFLDDNPAWLKIIHPYDSQTKDNGDDVFTHEMITQFKNQMSEEKFAQEFACDMTAMNDGSIYGKSLNKATYVNEISILPNECVYITCDLGISDATSFVFSVIRDNKAIIIHTYENTSQPTQHYIDYLDNYLEGIGAKKWNAKLIVPHDAANRADGLKMLTSRASYYIQADFNVVRLRPQGVDRGIECLRASIEHGSIAWEDTKEIKKMIRKLKTYEYKFVNGVNTYTPLHGKGASASNLADALEYLAIYMFYTKYIDTKKKKEDLVFKEILGLL